MATKKNKPAKSIKQAAEKVQAKNTKAAEAGRKELQGFVNFIRTQGVIGLAVGLAIGTAAGDTVRKLVEGFINPIVQFIVGSESRLSNAVWHVEIWGRQADFAWGAFVSSLITLIATALVIYIIIHGLKLDRLDKKKS